MYHVLLLFEGSWGHFLSMTDAVGFLSKVYNGERRDLTASGFHIPVQTVTLWCVC